MLETTTNGDQGEKLSLADRIAAKISCVEAHKCRKHWGPNASQRDAIISYVAFQPFQGRAAIGTRPAGAGLKGQVNLPMEQLVWLAVGLGRAMGLSLNDLLAMLWKMEDGQC